MSSIKPNRTEIKKAYCDALCLITCMFVRYTCPYNFYTRA